MQEHFQFNIGFNFFFNTTLLELLMVLEIVSKYHFAHLTVFLPIQGCSEKTDTFVLLPTSLFMVQQLRNGDQMEARENAICASTNPSCRKVSCISLQHMFQMGAFSHHAQLCSLAHFLDHVAAHFWRDRLNGTGDGLLQLWNILGVVF